MIKVYHKTPNFSSAFGIILIIFLSGFILYIKTKNTRRILRVKNNNSIKKVKNQLNYFRFKLKIYIETKNTRSPVRIVYVTLHRKGTKLEF